MNMSSTHIRLLDFLDQHGKSPAEEFPCTALGLYDAKAFVNILLTERVRPLGIELWRSTDKGYRVDGPKGWYAEAAELEADTNSALEYLNSSVIGQNDLFVFQF